MVYVWACAECKQTTDVVRPSSEIDVPPAKCEHCQSQSFTGRVIVRPSNCKGYILEGGGWHNDTYSKYRSIT